jgi:hypothetical protein
MKELMLGLGAAKINLNVAEVVGFKTKPCLKALTCHPSKIAPQTCVKVTIA